MKQNSAPGRNLRRNEPNIENELQKAALVGLAYEARKQSIGNPAPHGKDGKYQCYAERNIGGRTSEKIGEELGISSGKVDHSYRFLVGLRALEKQSPGVTDVILSGSSNANLKNVEEIRLNSEVEQKEFADAVLNSTVLPDPRKMPSRLKRKNEQLSTAVY